ncbi:MAG: helix-turn-helix domain-containing protein [Anaerolineales bacterium]|nr:helix-turn-helix domain-containing protein [Anaerolineales bacterium]MCB9126310.1 helix-turn-helix domain-containing protein [Ardenticatenales bacterium]MCB9171305.1 helix-turn-helix domain-containing protein [Ardenticatenales bacterium]
MGNHGGNQRERLLGTGEVARILGVHVQTVRRYIRAKELPAIQLTPRNYKVRQSDLDHFLDGRCTIAGQSGGVS